MPGRPPLRAVVFDLDGTLVDTRHDLARAVNLTRADHRLPELPVAAVVALVGEGVDRLVGRALGGAVGGPALSRAVDAFLAHYRSCCLQQSRPYAGVPRVLAAVSAQMPAAVLTNKPESLSRAILEGLGLAGFFREVVGGDTFPTRKPDPAGLLALCGRLASRPKACLLVGDSEVDRRTAHSAGAPFAFCRWGFGGAAAGVGAEWTLAAPEDLLSLLDLGLRVATPEGGAGGGGAR